MTGGLRRFHLSRQSHFLTVSCYHRQPKFNRPEVCDLFLDCLEAMRHRFGVRIYGYVVMPEHVHLLVSEPDHGVLADAMHYVKLSFAKRLKSKMAVPQSTVPQVRGRSMAANWDKRTSKQPPRRSGKSATTIAMFETKTSSV